MRLTQLTEAPDTQELEQKVQALVSRYEQLFAETPITEQVSKQLMDVVQELKQQLLASEDNTYQGIDFLMREISHAHDVNVHDMHDAFVDATSQTPDEWIQSHKSTT